MKKQNLLFTVLMAVISISSFGQVGIGTTDPNPNSLLDLFSSEKGLLLPRINLVQLSSSSPLSVHTQGMIVYNLTDGNDVKPGLYYNDGSKWIKMSAEIDKIGDIKYGFQTTDHNGWYLLDGRSVASLPQVARDNAQAIGISTNLFNATNKFFRTLLGTQNVGQLLGTDSFSIAQANLPNIQFPAIINDAGSHSHTYTDNRLVSVQVGNSGGENPIARNQSVTRNTFSAGSHQHTISIPSGGSGLSINYTPPYVAANAFIYLGN